MASAGPLERAESNFKHRKKEMRASPVTAAVRSLFALKIRDVVLILLVVQSTSIVLLMRYSKTRPRDRMSGPAYLSSAAVLMAESLKLPVCGLMAAHVLGGFGPLRAMLAEELFGTGLADTLKCAVPAIAYTIQGNLLFVALANLEAPTYQVSYQSKTLFTALFSAGLLGRRLKRSQWLALVLLVAGTILVSDPFHAALSKAAAGGGGGSESFTAGLLAVLAAALLSSSSSVYFEMMLKKAPSSAAVAATSLWLRNIQLGLFATPLAALAMVLQDGETVRAYGALHGFDSVVWLIVILNGIGGLLVAATMKYADNIAKCCTRRLASNSRVLPPLPPPTPARDASSRWLSRPHTRRAFVCRLTLSQSPLPSPSSRAPFSPCRSLDSRSRPSLLRGPRARSWPACCIRSRLIACPASAPAGPLRSVPPRLTNRRAAPPPATWRRRGCVPHLSQRTRQRWYSPYSRNDESCGGGTLYGGAGVAGRGEGSHATARPPVGGHRCRRTTVRCAPPTRRRTSPPTHCGAISCWMVRFSRSAPQST